MALWEESFTRKEGELKAALNVSALRKKKIQAPLLDLRQSLHCFEDFEASLEQICVLYSRRGVSKVVTEKLYPHFEHFRSLSGAITAATSPNVGSALCWAGLLATIQCCCEFAESIEGVIGQLEELHQLIPTFSETQALYNSNARLRFALRDIYEDYIDYCIVIIKHLTRSPIGNQLSGNLVRSFFSSSMRRNLQDKRARFTTHLQSFRDKADLAEREQQERNHVEMNGRLDRLIPSKQKLDPVFPVCTVTLPRNTMFMGREDELERLRNQLETVTSQHEPTSSLICGIGGVGKTHLALEYTYVFRNEYLCIFWLRAETDVQLRSSFGSIGRSLKLFESADIGQVEIEQVQEWLRSTDKPYLLVFDNVDSWTSISTYWPAQCNSRSAIIVTSQIAGSWTHFNLDLLPFELDNGARFILQKLGLEKSTRNEIECKDISDNVGGLPLWLNQAVGFIKSTNCTLSGYVENYRASSNLLGDQSTKENWAYERAIVTVFDPALRNLSADAKELLYMIAFMSADSIPESLLLPEEAIEDLEFLRKSNIPRYLSSVERLSNVELVSRQDSPDGAYLTVHRSVQEGMLKALNLNHSDRQRAFNGTVRLLRGAFPVPSPLQQAEPEKWPLTEMILPHVLALESAFRRAEPRVEGSMQFAQLLSDVGGMNMYDRGFIRDAMRLQETAERVLDEVNEPLHSPLRGDIGIILGLLSDYVGITERVKGLQIRIRATEIRERCFEAIPVAEVTNSDEIRLNNAYSDLACSHQQLNNFEEVEALSNRCFRQYQRWGGESEYPYEYAKYYHAMAFVLAHQNLMTEAVASGRRGAQLMAIACPGSQIATVYHFDMAIILFQSGETSLAIKEHRDILQRRKVECGQLNLLTLQSGLTLGILHYLEGDIAEAEALLRQSIEVGGRDQKTHWPVENVVRAKYYLARALDSKTGGDSQEALELHQEVRQAIEDLLPTECAVYARENLTDEAMMIDFLVPWGYRIVIPKQKKRLAEQTSNSVVK